VKTTDGFVRVPNWLIDDSDLTLHELAVYLVLLRFRDPSTGKCFPGMSTIADRARISRKTVERAIPKLETRGMIRVERRSSLQENKPNIYTVALADETPKFIWEKSKRGRRIPARRPTDSESVGRAVEFAPTDSQSLPTDSQSVPTDSESVDPQTPSRPKKIHTTRSTKKTHEQALRLTPQREPEPFTFTEAEKITDKQLDYLNDLHIFLTERPIDDTTRARWKRLDSTEASDLIRNYWSQIGRGRGGMWESTVDETHPLYSHLTQHGKRWVSNGAVPDMAGAA
jgi:hypothetical protein